MQCERGRHWAQDEDNAHEGGLGVTSVVGGEIKMPGLHCYVCVCVRVCACVRLCVPVSAIPCEYT